MTDDQGWLLYVSVMWASPWERPMNWLWCIDPDTNEIRREVRAGSLRDRLACFCDARDTAWRRRWARRRQRPPKRWRRRLESRTCQPVSAASAESGSPGSRALTLTWTWTMAAARL